jgi:hypothetical protein
LVCFGFLSEDGDISVWMETVDDAGAGGYAGAQAIVTDGDATVGTDFQSGAAAPDVGPPWATRGRTQDRTVLLASFKGRGIGSAAQFAVDFLGVTMATQCGQEFIGGFWSGDIFGGEQSGEPPLPVLMLAFDFAFGLGSAGVTQGDAVEVQGCSKLSQCFRSLREEKAVAIDVKFEWQAMFKESGGKEVKVGEQVFGVIDLGARANAGAIVQQIQEWVVSFVARKPPVRSGIELPECADFEALPAPDGSGFTPRGCGMGQIVGQGPSANGGWVDLKIETAMNFRGCKAVGSRGTSREQFTHERFNARRPIGGMIATGMAGSPEVVLIFGSGPQVIGIKLVEPGAAQVQLLSGGRGGQLITTKSGKDFPDQRCAQTVRELAIMFFIVEKMCQSGSNDQRATPALRAFRRPPLRSGLLQARRAGGVRLCSHTCPGLNAHCSPLLATQQNSF